MCMYVWIEFKLKYDFKIWASRVGRLHITWSKESKSLLLTISYPLLFTPRLAIVPSEFFVFLFFNQMEHLIQWSLEQKLKMKNKWNQTSLVGGPASNVWNCASCLFTLCAFFPPSPLWNSMEGLFLEENFALARGKKNPQANLNP